MGIGNMINRLLNKGDADSKAHDEISERGLADTPETEDIYLKEDLDVPDTKSAESGGADGGDSGTEGPGEISGENPGGPDGRAGESGAPVTEAKVLEVLSQVYDPEIPIDIVNLGLVYGVEIDGGNVLIRMTMTAPGCPASTQIAGESRLLVEEMQGVEKVDIDLVWDPPWDPSKMSEEAQQSMGMI